MNVQTVTRPRRVMTYLCTRCGAERTLANNRSKPQLCKDCCSTMSPEQRRAWEAQP